MGIQIKLSFRTIFSFLLLSFFFSNDILAQEIAFDTLALYENNRINRNTVNGKYLWNHRFRRKIIQHKQFYKDGSLQHVLSRFDDSTFVFTEYYHLNEAHYDYDSLSQVKKREGLALISQITHGDFLTRYDYDTYEAYDVIDTLLLPFKDWIFYNKRGKMYERGTYHNGRRNGSWLVYGDFFEVDKLHEYEMGKLKDSVFINVVLHHSKEETLKKLNGKFRTSKRKLTHQIKGIKTDTIAAPDHIALEFLSNSELLIHSKDEKLALVIEKGTWMLSAYNKIEFRFGEQILEYEIQYLSDDNTIMMGLNE